MASSSGDSSFLQVLHENYLECTLCYEMYKQPKYLTCHHTFCQGCLEDFRKHNPGDIVCQTCREVTKIPGCGIHGLRNNFLIRSLTNDMSLFRDKQIKCDNCSEGNMAAMVCVECAIYLCSGCFESHEKGKSISDSHNTFQVEKLQNVANLQQFQKNRFATCQIHNEPMKLYCTIDKIQLCHTCSFGSSHQSHKMCPIQEQLEELLVEITGTLEKSKINDSAIAEENKKLEEVKCEVENNETRSLADLDQEEAEILSKVKEKYNTMRNEIKAASEVSRRTCDAKIARNKILQNTGECKIAEKEALKMIPISSCIEAAEGFLASIRETDQSAIQKVDAEKEGTIMYFEAKIQGSVVNSGCVKSKIVSTVKMIEPVQSEPFDKSRPHFKTGVYVRVGDRVELGPDCKWVFASGYQAGTVAAVKHNTKQNVLVRWDRGSEDLLEMSDNKYELKPAHLT